LVKTKGGSMDIKDFKNEENGSQLLRFVLDNFRFSAFDRSARLGIYHIFKKLLSDWVSSALFQNREAYPPVMVFIPSKNPRSPYVRFIKKNLLLYAVFLYVQQNVPYKLENFCFQEDFST